MNKLINDLWFKRRDIISDGFDESLEYISKIIPLKVHEISTGTKCWTWTIPEKWTVKDAFIHDGEKKLLDIKDHPLHVISYSLSVDKEVTKEELIKHLHSRLERPAAIPYEFKYYERDWGFCIQHERLKDFVKDKYRVFIDSKFEKGTLKVGDFTVKGKTEDTIVLVAHLCHPTMANDDLTGVSVLVDVAKDIAQKDNHYSYKFLLVPETIGSVGFLSQNEDLIPKLKFGVFLEMLGNNNTLALQLSHQGNTKIDKIARYVMKKNLANFREGPFRSIVRNDEMVFNGPGVNIPMISISRFPYPEYHSSDDNPGIISEARLNEAKNIVLNMLDIIDRDYVPKRNFKGPIFLSGYGLWVDWRTNKDLKINIEQIMLNLEGDISIFEISEKLNLDFDLVFDFVSKLKAKNLVQKVE
ncbi:MAG: hypothetical protein AMJ78_00925 [Omnitrophica WOR_2 bacterium SM23_29]|nr:MAG: hypothetical protein AMJ78_00925 [Omnitrophica WOR_2 bacterium SM23_29]